MESTSRFYVDGDDCRCIFKMNVTHQKNILANCVNYEGNNCGFEELAYSEYYGVIENIVCPSNCTPNWKVGDKTKQISTSKTIKEAKENYRYLSKE